VPNVLRRGDSLGSWRMEDAAHKERRYMAAGRFFALGRFYLSCIESLPCGRGFVVVGWVWI
jgi:hypothetical protein